MYYIHGLKVTTEKPSERESSERENLGDAYELHCKAFTVVPEYKVHLLEAYRRVVRELSGNHDLFNIGRMVMVKVLIHRDLGIDDNLSE